MSPHWTDEGHCVTLISDITPHDLMTALATNTIAQAPGIDALVARTVERWDAGYNPDEAIIGVADAGAGWTLIAEVNGYLGVTETIIGPLTGGRTAVAHFRNVNAVQRFNWWRDRRLLIDVDLMFPDERFGEEPDALGDLCDIGSDTIAAGFTLAQRITGVSCGPELFERAEFTVAVAPLSGPTN